MIYLALHGETEWNRERRIQGRLDSKLTAHGIEQAHRMGATLKRLMGEGARCDIISPLGRTMATARIICEMLGIETRSIETDLRLAEVDLGSWAGLTREEVGTRWLGELQGPARREWYFRSPDGETFDHVSARVGSWLTDMEARPHSIVAITHGFASRVLRGVYAQLAHDEALALEVSRDAIAILADGSIRREPCR